MEAKLIKIDRNGSKHFEGLVTCDRCGGSGIYAHHVENGVVVPNWNYDGICLKCNGKGKVIGKWIERTPEYQAKLDAKREAKWKAEQEKRQAEYEAELAEQERIRAEKEAAIKAEKARSQYVGTVGKRETYTLTKVRTASFDVPSPVGWGTMSMHIHILVDEHGNKFTWKTQNSIHTDSDDSREWVFADEGDTVVLKGTLKEHSEYKDEKQNVLTRCKIISITKN